MRSPLLFLVFNRPDTTALVFETIRQARPPRLYVAADGPRPLRSDEAQLCEATRRVATNVDWPCEVRTLWRDVNLGCKKAVSGAVDWFFEHEPDGVILEDDCLPDPSFFVYCDAILERYRDDERVMSITGANFIAPAWQAQASYYFSHYAQIWGWASWRRAWRHYRVDLSAFSVAELRASLARAFPDSLSARIYWFEYLSRVRSGALDTWDYQWSYALLAHGGLCCVPNVNLVRNIGFGVGATHTTNPESKFANLPAKSLQLPLTHPARVTVDAAADHWLWTNIFEIDRFVARRLSLGGRMRSARRRLREWLRG